MDLHCEILWKKNSGAGLGCRHRADYGAAAYDDENQACTSQQNLIPMIIKLCIRNSLNTYVKRKL